MEREWQRERARLTRRRIMHLSKCQTGDSLKDKKARVLFTQLYFEKEKGKGGKVKDEKEKKETKVSLYGSLASVYTDSIENA